MPTRLRFVTSTARRRPNPAACGRPVSATTRAGRAASTRNHGDSQSSALNPTTMKVCASRNGQHHGTSTPSITSPVRVPASKIPAGSPRSVRTKEQADDLRSARKVDRLTHASRTRNAINVPRPVARPISPCEIDHSANATAYSQRRFTRSARTPIGICMKRVGPEERREQHALRLRPQVQVSARSAAAQTRSSRDRSS